jgi:thiosulfate reductase / polysulfide reductase chain A
MSFSRREFIRIGAAGAGATAVASGLLTDFWSLDAREIRDPATDGDRVVPTFCELCFWKCGVLAHVKDGRVTKIVGNPAHPLSRGRVCPRGAGGTGLLYDPDRLRTPLVRRSKRGSQEFEPVSWETALDATAEGMERIRREHGPEALALFTHGFGGSFFSTLTRAYGSPNIVAPSYAQCRGPREVAFSLTFGEALGSPEPLDLANARCITLIGSHLGENMHNTQVQDFAEALGRGADLVVVDPRFSTAASKARYWLPIKPGTDVALLLAWIHVIVTERRYDAEYIAQHATGFAELARHVETTTPEWAYPITGIRPDAIRETARVIAAARPASLIHPGRRATWYGDDTQRLRAVAILAALLGSWGRRGGYISQSAMPLPRYPAPPVPEPEKPVADRAREDLYPLAEETLASGVCDATLPGKAPYQIRGWLVYGTNLIQALPDPRHVEEEISHLDLLVAIDVLPAEITGWADIVLPESTYLERWDDLWAARYREPFVAVRQPVVEPMYDSRAGWWIAKELARRLGIEEHFPFADGRDNVVRRLSDGGYDVGEALRTGVVAGERLPVSEEEGLGITFDTVDGKIQLYSRDLEAAGFDPLPNYTPHEEPPAGMFRLLMGRSPAHTFGRTANNRFLAQAFPENEVWVNATVARSLPRFDRPLLNGERVVLENQDGVRSLPVKAKVTERIRGDAVYMVHGWGHTAKGLTYAHGRGASTSELTTRYATDPVMGGTGINVNFVRIERAEG